MIATIQRTSEQQMQDTPVLLRCLTYLRILTGEAFIVAIRQQVDSKMWCTGACMVQMFKDEYYIYIYRQHTSRVW